jgi:hypothetical protein
MPTKKLTRKEREKLSRDSLSDSYVISLLIKGFNDIIQPNKSEVKASDIRKYPELIECKRIQLKIIRLLKSTK